MQESEFLKKIREHRGILIKISKMYFELKQDQEDLFQEILLQLWRSVGSYRQEAAFSTWLYKVALNTAIVYFKKESKEAEAKVLVKRSEEDLRVEAFYQAIRHLNKVERAIIIQYIDGLSGEEIAANLGLTPINIRVKLNRTKQKLKNIIKEKEYGF